MDGLWFVLLLSGVCGVGLFFCLFPFQKVEAIRGKGVVTIKNVGKLNQTEHYYLEKFVEEVFRNNPSVNKILIVRFCDWILERTDGKIEDERSIKKLKSLCSQLFKK